MAAPLRHALRLLTWAAVALIYLPLLPAAALMALPALRLSLWQSLFADPQFGQALAATLVSTLLSVGGALIITLTVVAALWPSGGWRRLAARLPLLLACPTWPSLPPLCCCLPKAAGSLAFPTLFPADRPLRHRPGPDYGR
ncbi:ABC transporter permease [Klebsiella grimontii]|uniref:ABC transporter permease n=1 Tax=Klebsiella grimontii TaxID=2058152 RepID=A0A7H4P5G5_9ENTR|nr:ABC transporter permease [Klebsiella grimontii]